MTTKILILTRRDLREKKGIPFSDAHIDRLVEQGKFPPPFKLGHRTDAWLEDAVDRFILARSKCRKSPASPERRAQLSAAGKKGMASRWGTAA